MTKTRPFASDVAFTESVKAVQQRKGSRHAYQRMEEGGSWETRITPELKSFIESQTSVFLATASAEGQPYVQHRGGPPGFLRVLDDATIAFVDFAGNRQFISVGNLAENPKAQLFLIDYGQRMRIKIWGEASAVGLTPTLEKQLMPAGYSARPEQVLRFRVSAWDANCAKHIPRRFEADEVATALADRDVRIAELERELATLRTVMPAAAPGAGNPGIMR
jgi:predicted pyridoxine 5'-phosphate oxidase superfamily flavin-nucleotide-binding protein